MNDHDNCPGCTACAALGITDQPRTQLIHALTAHFLDFGEIQQRADQLGFELSDGVVDTVGMCVSAAMARLEASCSVKH